MSSRRKADSECRQCKRDGYTMSLYRDKSDNRVYCLKCWKDYYGSAPPEKCMIKLPPPNTKLKVEGRPVTLSGEQVDSYFPFPDDEESVPTVYHENGASWAAKMKMFAAGETPQFAYLQLITDDKNHWTFYRSGTIGEAGTANLFKAKTLADAKDNFCKIFKQQTGNLWLQVGGCAEAFRSQKGLFTLVVDSRGKSVPSATAVDQKDSQQEKKETSDSPAANQSASEKTPAADETKKTSTVEESKSAPEVASSSTAEKTRETTVQGSAQPKASEPPQTQAAAPKPTEAKKETVPAASSKQESYPTPPAAPSQRPAAPPAKPAAPTAAPEAAPAKQATPPQRQEAPPQQQPAPKKKIQLQADEEEEKSSMLVPIVAVAGIAIAGALAWNFLRKK